MRADVGGRTQRNIDNQPLVSFLWPARQSDGHTLIVDADGSTAGTPCDSDCITLFPA